MKVFLSWSGETSKAVAEALFNWLPNVIQSVEPYFSNHSIEKGARGLNDIAVELEETNFGILCLTKQNSASPWINFEAGALSKRLTDGKVAPFLFDMAISDIEKNSPLTQFQATYSGKKDDVLKLVQSLNNANALPLDANRLKEAFENWWPKLEESLYKIPVSVPAHQSKKPEPKMTTQTEEKIFEILDELLGLSRQQLSVLKSPKDLLPPMYIQANLDAHRMGLRRIPDSILSDDSVSNPSWTEDKIKMLKEMWQSGCSASQIADTLGEGVTRNTVIGKAHRLGLSGQSVAMKRNVKKPTKKNENP